MLYHGWYEKYWHAIRHLWFRQREPKRKSLWIIENDNVRFNINVFTNHCDHRLDFSNIIIICYIWYAAYIINWKVRWNQWSYYFGQVGLWWSISFPLFCQRFSDDYRQLIPSWWYLQAILTNKIASYKILFQYFIHVRGSKFGLALF